MILLSLIRTFRQVSKRNFEIDHYLNQTWWLIEVNVLETHTPSLDRCEGILHIELKETCWKRKCFKKVKVFLQLKTAIYRTIVNHLLFEWSAAQISIEICLIDLPLHPIHCIHCIASIASKKINGNLMKTSLIRYMIVSDTHIGLWITERERLILWQAKKKRNEHFVIWVKDAQIKRKSICLLNRIPIRRCIY